VSELPCMSCNCGMQKTIYVKKQRSFTISWHKELNQTWSKKSHASGFTDHFWSGETGASIQ